MGSAAERTTGLAKRLDHWPIANLPLETKSPAERPGDRKYLISERMRYL
jgi:hypothetical protein